MTDDLEKRLTSINDLAEKLYTYIEQGNVRLTRRRLLVIQGLLFTDHSSNTVFTLLRNNPPQVDGAQMIMRSVYDLITNIDYILKDRTNKRLWRWYRDDRKVLLRNIHHSITLKEAHPNMTVKGDRPLEEWKQTERTVKKSFKIVGKRAGLSSKQNEKEKEVGTYQKVRSFSPKAQMVYHTVFWLFSTKIHASPTGLQDFVTFEPLHLKRRSESSQRDDKDMYYFGATTLTWYAAQLYRASKYLKTPFVSEIKPIYEESFKRPSTS